MVNFKGITTNVYLFEQHRKLFQFQFLYDLQTHRIQLRGKNPRSEGRKFFKR